MSRLPVLVLLSAVLVTGCGSDEEAGSPRGYDSPVPVVQDYVDAFGAGDFAVACGHIAAETLDRVTESGARPCEDVYAEGGDEVSAAQEQFSGAEVTDPQVSGDSGTVGVRTADGQEIRLTVVREDGTWKVAS